ncbi:MAG TPA: diacylglycerol kinase family protein [Anaerolineales bacterium]|nr:diacylglycerol kinase family protein [Anaerolineales bacterium]
MPPKIKIILNPVADMGNSWKVANDLRPMITAHGNADWSGTVYPTHATELAKQAAEQGYERIIAMGGDGTVHEVVNGIMQAPEGHRPVLGVVPVGSGNDFAHALGIPLESDRALACALDGKPSSIDLGMMTDEQGRREFFDNTLGIGFDTVVTIRSHKLPIVRGFLMYFTAVIQTILLNHDPSLMQMDIDGQQWEQSNLMLTVCNGPREGGGFLVAPEAKIDDGLLHYAVIRKVSRPMMFRLLPEVMKGTHGKFEPVRLGTCKTMKVTADRPMYIHADGEIYTGFGSNIRGVSFDVLPGALQVVRA